MRRMTQPHQRLGMQLAYSFTAEVERLANLAVESRWTSI
jgi:hypothetical protein